MILAEGVDDIAGELSVVWPGFEDAPWADDFLCSMPCGDVMSEQLAKHHAAGDAGGEIPGSPDAGWLAGVVSRLGMIEGELHKIVEPQG